MKPQKTIEKHYLETGVLGAYETAEVVYEEETAGKYAPCFDDSLLVFRENQTSMERVMMIEGKHFRIKSLFSVATSMTPTDKMLNLIDADIERERTV